MKAKWDKTHIESPFRINDVVWYKIGQQKKGENRKLAPKYTGSYKITNIVNSEHRLVVDITHLNNLNDQHRVSIRQLKKAFLKPEQLGTLEKTSSKDSEKKNTTKAESSSDNIIP